MDYPQFRLADQAVADLDGIANYIGERNPAAADRVLDTLFDTFSFLGENADVGTPRGDLVPDLRVFSPPRPAHSYVIAYFKTKDVVEINAVVHGSRDWPQLITGGER